MLDIEQYYTEKYLDLNKDLLSGAVRVESVSQLLAMPDCSAQTLRVEDLLNSEMDYLAVLEQCRRVLKDGGVLLCTTASIVPAKEARKWGFTVTSMKYVFEMFFEPDNIDIAPFGNALAGRLLMSGETLPSTEMAKLDKTDPIYAVIIGVRATKK